MEAALAGRFFFFVWLGIIVRCGTQSFANPWGKEMRIFVWVLRLVIFAVLVAFAAQNHVPVTLKWFGQEWQAPLAVVLLATALVGILLGLSFTVGTLVRQRWTLSRLRRRLEATERVSESSDRTLPPV